MTLDLWLGCLHLLLFQRHTQQQISMANIEEQILMANIEVPARARCRHTKIAIKKKEEIVSPWLRQQAGNPNACLRAFARQHNMDSSQL